MNCDFSLTHYRELLRAARDGGYRWAGFDAAPSAGDLILRHDVDLSLDGALAVAEVEAEEGAWSTWFLMTRSVFYNLASPEGERAIERLRSLGHRVAHHAVWPNVDLDARFDPVVAWHNPDPEYMREPIAGAVNVMEPPFFDPDHYRSDSNQHWRHGCPHEELAARIVRVAAAVDASGDLGVRGRDDARVDGVDARRRPRRAARASAARQNRPLVTRFGSPAAT